MGPEPGIEIPNPLDFKDTETAGTDPGADPQAASMSADLDLMSEETFFELFSGLIESPNIVLSMKGVDPLESLKVNPGDAQARAASGVLYKICLRTRWMRWMLAPEAEWAKDLMIVGAFAFGKFRLVRAELDARLVESKSADPAAAKTEDRRDKTMRDPTQPDDDAPPVDTGQDNVLVVGGAT